MRSGGSDDFVNLSLDIEVVVHREMDWTQSLFGGVSPEVLQMTGTADGGSCRGFCQVATAFRCRPGQFGGGQPVAPGSPEEHEVYQLCSALSCYFGDDIGSENLGNEQGRDPGVREIAGTGQGAG